MATFPLGPLVGGTFAIDGELSARFAPGTVVDLSDGGIAVYVSAASTISQYMTVIVDEHNAAFPITTTNAATNKRVAHAQTSIASAYFGWVQVGGSPKVQLAANCAPAVPLFTTATAGVLDDATVSESVVLGLVSAVSISNATAVTCIAARGEMIGTGLKPA